MRKPNAGRSVAIDRPLDLGDLPFLVTVQSMDRDPDMIQEFSQPRLSGLVHTLGPRPFTSDTVAECCFLFQNEDPQARAGKETARSRTTLAATS